MGKKAVKGLFYGIIIAVTCAVAAITVLASFSGLYSPVESKMMPLLGLLVPVLLLVNLLLAVGWGLARKLWVAMPLLAILFHWNYLSAVLQFHFWEELPPKVSPFRSDPRGFLTVATYNVCHFGDEVTGYSCKRMATFMKEARIDVICFQEFGGNAAFPLDSIRKALSHWKYSVVDERAGQSIRSVAVFSRFPLVNPRFITYPQSMNCSMRCDLVLGTDTLRLLNNHLQTTSVNQNRKRWEAELSASDAKREAKAMYGIAGTLHENFVRRAEQADTLCRLIEGSPYPVIACLFDYFIPASNSGLCIIAKHDDLIAGRCHRTGDFHSHSAIGSGNNSTSFHLLASFSSCSISRCRESGNLFFRCLWHAISKVYMRAIQ